MVIKTKIRPTLLKETETRNTMITVTVMVMLGWSVSEQHGTPNCGEFKLKGGNGEARNVDVFSCGR